MKQKFFYCYILYSSKLNQSYVGYTSNLKQRLVDHHNNPTRTTARADDWKLVWYASFRSKELAEKFEKYLKTGNGRVFMRKRLIGNLVEVNDNKE
ncbi:GIY-YIG nuclease family protein [Candidatus Dojkabacteria bacterium]|uniref:GIY-YIG nuclease family protein n=1 Tax=Candidatus Dojkabacteria bacterium TaxID=2099670 RepID=A0A955RMG6_9BACT|nr:GIY-YIG nuclease family protein [Candidatus Dojkabacteria bacterium]